MLLAGVLAHHRILRREHRVWCLEGCCRAARAGGPHAQ